MDVSRIDFLHNPAWLDESAFEALFFEHYSVVYGVVFRLTGDPHEADDLTAETFWRLWQRPPSRAENIAGWLFRVATRLGYNALRGSRRRDDHESAAARNLPEGAWGAAAAPDPAYTVEQREERANVRAILRQMPLREVQVLTLRHAGLSYKEIAAALEVAPGSIGTLLARAEARFAARYREKHQKGEADAPER
jgi:RNA polymerase sigma-70 factor (ECF subfamily)